MAGLRGISSYIAIGKQSAKGTPATQPKFKYPFVGGNVQPTRDTDNLAETDSQRDQGVTFIKSSGVEGAPQIYVRDSSITVPLFGVLGASADTGATNYTHTITPTSALPYFTVWRGIGDALWEQFTDVMISELAFSAATASPLTATLTLMGRTPLRLAADPAPGWSAPVVNLESGSVYNYNDATVTLSGGATSLISSFDMTIANNVTLQQTDDVIPYDLVPGMRTINLSFDLIFENLTEYNLFHYGASAGTVLSPNLYVTSADFLFSKGVNNSVDFSLPSIAYEEFPVEPQPDGAPVTVSVRAQAQRGASPILTAIVKNQNATAV